MREIRLSAMDLNLMLVFDAVMVERNVSAAAARLNRTQSAVSHSLAKLRQLVEDPLFVRTGSGMVPTVHALEIAPLIHEALTRLQDALAVQRPFNPAEAKGTVSVGMTDYMAYILIPALIERLGRTAPGIEIKVVPSYAKVSVGALESENILMFVGHEVHNPPSWVASEPMFEETQVCVARAGHTLLDPSRAAEVFREAQHVEISPWGQPGMVNAALARHGITRRIAITVGTFLAVAPIVERSELISLLPARLALGLARHYAISVSEVPYEMDVSPIAITWHRRHDRDARIAWVRREIAAVLRNCERAPHETGRTRVIAA